MPGFNIDICIFWNEIKLLKRVTCRNRLPTHYAWSQLNSNVVEFLKTQYLGIVIIFYTNDLIAADKDSHFILYPDGFIMLLYPQWLKKIWWVMFIYNLYEDFYMVESNNVYCRRTTKVPTGIAPLCLFHLLTISFSCPVVLLTETCFRLKLQHPGCCNFKLT